MPTSDKYTEYRERRPRFYIDLPTEEREAFLRNHRASVDYALRRYRGRGFSENYMAAADLVLGKPYIVATYLAFAGLGVYLFEGGDPGFAWVLSKFVFGSLFVGFVFLLYSYAGDQIRWRRSKVHGDE